jgi:tetratricopeptide (TPR) repeat protein
MSETSFNRIDGRTLSASYFACLAVYVVWLFLNTPISAGDTDLWFHLSGGKYLFDNGEVSKSSYFSFLTPERSWYTYWLFQAVVYVVFHLVGYQGLIIYRLVVFSAFATILYLYLMSSNDGKVSRIGMNILFLFSAVILLSRFFNIIPHNYSYILIILFIYIIEYRRRWIVLLPFIAVLWVNIHGTEYPVMYLIVCSYLAEMLLETIRRRSGHRKDIVPALFLSACGATVLASPGGATLIWLPFKAGDLIVSLIQEMSKINFVDLFSLHFSLEYMDPGTLWCIYAAIFITVYIVAILGGKCRISHLLLSGGAIFLLFKGFRFTIEFVLLTLPLVKHSILPSDGVRSANARMVYVATTLLAAMPFLFLNGIFSETQSIGRSYKYLPHGVVGFLKKVLKGGKVMNYPNNGGFYRWELYPLYKIFTDMEVPFLFTGKDIFTSVTAYSDAVVLEGVISRYNPDFIIAPLPAREFDGLIGKHKKYVRVFFDDSDVLYVNGEAHPDVAKRYNLKYFNPFSIAGNQFVMPDKDMAAKYLDDLAMVYSMYPDGYLVMKMLTFINFKLGSHAQALVYADAGIEKHRHMPDFHELKGEILAARRQYAAAVAAFKTARGISGSRADKDRILLRIGFCYSKLDKTGMAYLAFRDTVNLYQMSYSELYSLGLMAEAMGKKHEAASLFNFAYLKTPSDNATLKQEIWTHLPAEDKLEYGMDGQRR